MHGANPNTKAKIIGRTGEKKKFNKNSAKNHSAAKNDGVKER